MNRYLIFRTDRIGDFIFSRIITDSIKKQNSSNIIDFVCSKYNASYVKNFKDINKIFILDKYNLSLMLKNLIYINAIKYDYLIVLDGKRRSIFFSIFLNAKYKFALVKDWRPYYLLKFFFDKFLINAETKTQYNNFITLANLIDLKVAKKIDYYKSYIFKTNKNIFKQSNFVLLHLDEKWFEGFYYDDFNYMNLTYKNFNLLINVIFKKFKKSIIITSGNIKVPIFNQILNKHFKKKDNNMFESIKFGKKLKLIDNTDFQELETIVKQSSVIICCEGAISHVSHAMNKKTYALINTMETAKFWTDHMSKITLLRRGSIKQICNDLKKF